MVALTSRPEGAFGGRAAAGNGCGWERPDETMREEEKVVYNAGTISADTAYCHHFNEVHIYTLFGGEPWGWTGGGASRVTRPPCKPSKALLRSAVHGDRVSQSEPNAS